MSDIAEEFARKFHESYERIAPLYGYATRKDTRVFDPESPNGKTMRSVCADVLHDLFDELESLRKRLAEADALLREESHEQYRFTQMTEYPSVTRMLLWHMDRKRRIDAHLSRKEK